MYQNQLMKQVKSYIKGSEERKELMKTYLEMKNSKVNIPLYIGDKEINTDNKKIFHLLMITNM